MTPQDKLKEIEGSNLAMTSNHDIRWLIARIYELQKACEEISKNIGHKSLCETEMELSFCDAGCRAVLIAEKALKGEP